jgi:allophanate hydrolase subunit 2
LFLDGEWRISATSDRMGYLEIRDQTSARHNIVRRHRNGSIQVPGNGQPIVPMPTAVPAAAIRRSQS